MDEREKPHYQELLRVLGPVDGWLARIDPSAAKATPQPHSPMAADDALLAHYQLSVGAWISLIHAVDNLSCLRALLRDLGWIHMFAPFTLVRGALENAAVAVWMLQPAKRHERLIRRLRMAREDIKNGEATKRLIFQPGPRSQDERMQELSEIAKRAGLPDGALGKKLVRAEVVNAAGAALNADASTYASASWRLSSGISHGDLWATLAATELVELPGATVDLPQFRLSANVTMLMYVVATATHMTAYGWHLFDLRSQPPY